LLPAVTVAVSVVVSPSGVGLSLTALSPTIGASVMVTVVVAVTTLTELLAVIISV
jgi:hypothetical protein